MCFFTGAFQKRDRTLGRVLLKLLVLRGPLCSLVVERLAVSPSPSPVPYGARVRRCFPEADSARGERPMWSRRACVMAVPPPIRSELLCFFRHVLRGSYYL